MAKAKGTGLFMVWAEVPADKEHDFNRLNVTLISATRYQSAAEKLFRPCHSHSPILSTWDASICTGPPGLRGCPPLAIPTPALHRPHVADHRLDRVHVEVVFAEKTQALRHQRIVIGNVPGCRLKLVYAGSFRDIDPDFRDQNALKVQANDIHASPYFRFPPAGLAGVGIASGGNTKW